LASEAVIGAHPGEYLEESSLPTHKACTVVRGLAAAIAATGAFSARGVPRLACVG